MIVDAEHSTTEANCRAWNARRYDAWLSAFQSPKAEAARIVADPERILRRLLPYLGQVADKRICNVQGSHGRVAVALAYLQADVMVIDFSQENQRFVLELAAAAELRPFFRTVSLLTLRGHFPSHIFKSLDRCLVANTGMPALSVVEDLDVFEDCSLGLSAGSEPLTVHQLLFQ